MREEKKRNSYGYLFKLGVGTFKVCVLVDFLDKCKLQKKKNLIFPVMTKKKQQVLAIFFHVLCFQKIIHACT